jgi:hypothetical protein
MNGPAELFIAYLDWSSIISSEPVKLFSGLGNFSDESVLKSLKNKEKSVGLSAACALL